nr:Chain P, Naturally processed octapeptide PKB1 [synthetic construct]1KJ2_Q Chain Q, Naturally processed octapeptide PKB1 [synthetic construct]1KJ3_P Chain P, NATURALLY PROCESSED OCTAPEPTIDE PKB1 [synthetic construct]1KJ3_Q Chain Q, NATURALLY PROCESSED OCTAPEPTIDE PKB1 [synthetic construct]
KVITFIDL